MSVHPRANSDGSSHPPKRETKLLPNCESPVNGEFGLASNVCPGSSRSSGP